MLRGFASNGLTGAHTDHGESSTGGRYLLLEGLRVRKESEDRIVEISKELELLYQRKEELENFAKHDDIYTKLK